MAIYLKFDIQVFIIFLNNYYHCMYSENNNQNITIRECCVKGCFYVELRHSL